MNKSSAIHVACSTDDSYAVLCGVMLYSLLANSNDSKQIHIHILISSLNKENRKKVLHTSGKVWSQADLSCSGRYTVGGM